MVRVVRPLVPSTSSLHNALAGLMVVSQALCRRFVVRPSDAILSGIVSASHGFDHPRWLPFLACSATSPCNGFVWFLRLIVSRQVCRPSFRHAAYMTRRTVGVRPAAHPLSGTSFRASRGFSSHPLCVRLSMQTQTPATPLSRGMGNTIDDVQLWLRPCEHDIKTRRHFDVALPWPPQQLHRSRQFHQHLCSLCRP